MNRYHQDADWQGLADAIIAQAGEDYRKAAEKLRTEPRSYLIRRIEQIEDFFLSDDFDRICTLNGAAIVRDLRRLCFPEEDRSSAQEGGDAAWPM